MASLPQLTFKILPPTAFSFGLPLFALAVLLQPAIPAHYSRPLRLALAYPAVHAAYYAPYTYRHEPAEFSIPANFRWGIFAPYAILLALYWAFMNEKDRRVELAWVGFDGEKREALHQTIKAEEKLEKADEGETGARRAKLEATAQVVAPTPVRPDTAAKLAAVLPAATASATPAVVAQPGYLPTPSPTPPFEDINPPSVSSAAPPPADLDIVSASSSSTLGTAQRQHPFHLLLSALHLLTSMRGVGYVFGPPMKHLPTPPRSERQFAKEAIVTFFTASVISTACVALQVFDRDGQLPLFLATVVPFLPISAAIFISALMSRICIGLSLWVQMKIGFSGLAVGFWLLHHLTNCALDSLPFFSRVTWRSTFDTREYPPLFNRPFSGMGEGGCSRFWSAKWHFLFRAVFTGTLYNPTSKVAKKVGVPKRAAALLGAVLVFAGSAWMHWQALVSARHGAEPTAAGLAYLSSHSIPFSAGYSSPWSDLTTIERHGTWIFFLLQPVAIIFEQLFTLLTKKRIGSWAGKLWTVAWIVIAGEAIIGRSWLALGLVHGIPPVDRWGWQRWVMPTYEMAPMPAFMSS